MADPAGVGHGAYWDCVFPVDARGRLLNSPVRKAGEFAVRTLRIGLPKASTLNGS